MGIQFPPIAFLYLLYLFIYVFFSYIIHIFVQWYKALLKLNIKLKIIHANPNMQISWISVTLALLDTFSMFSIIPFFTFMDFRLNDLD